MEIRASTRFGESRKPYTFNLIGDSARLRYHKELPARRGLHKRVSVTQHFLRPGFTTRDRFGIWGHMSSYMLTYHFGIFKV